MLLRTILLLALLGAPAARAHADGPVFATGPRIGLQAAVDSNYDFAATDATAVGIAGGEVGWTAVWVPGLRHRLAVDVSAQGEELTALSSPTASPGASFFYEGGLGWSFLTSLRTRLDLSVAGYRYRAARLVGGRTSYGGQVEGLFTWAPDAPVEGALFAGTRLTADAAANLDPRRDTEHRAEARLRWRVLSWLAVPVAAGLARSVEDEAVYRYDGWSVRGGLAAPLWRGASASLTAAYRVRDYGSGRADARVAGYARFDQRVAASHRITLSAAAMRNHSNVFSYERATARLLWEFAPLYWF